MRSFQTLVCPAADRDLSGHQAGTVCRWIAEKQMLAHRLGRLWKFRGEDVDDWVKSGGADDAKDKGEEGWRNPLLIRSCERPNMLPNFITG
jgi:excisionase family DNA binding protein